ncbi:MBL fold metallo-hydrolase [Acidaminobacter sp. JC074]|uniref:MBL fold metallo-hydrolase n=1 Tax=Acidaminobacter sp. JC074 TaxID=2530199 RepID=UPI001F0F37B5|nr:MBL fold metallo-hydrolase [Acidaminobacter sp. JC074]MCH4886203.1 MBL fold metallo-hydrolase [Acidaminobacter sp. JC074]
MKIEIIGSGGCVSLPKPLCSCKVCEEARMKGRPYSRYGPSIFVHDINLLIDTPEDICHAINASSIKKIEAVAYSHMDPDHILGFRVFEQLRLNWFDVGLNIKCDNPINVYARAEVMEDLNKIQSKYGPYLDYYEKGRNLIKRQSLDKKVFDQITMTLIPVGGASVFVFEDKKHKVIYAPCDVKPFPDNELFFGADVMIIGNTVIGETLKDGYILPEDSFMRKELFDLDQIMDLKDRYDIHHVIMTHLEEDWGKSYDDYKVLENQYVGLSFAYDSMMIDTSKL